jgi:hypothetical protein
VAQAVHIRAGWAGIHILVEVAVASRVQIEAVVPVGLVGEEVMTAAHTGFAVLVVVLVVVLAERLVVVDSLLRNLVVAD